MTVLTDRTHDWADDQANRPSNRGRHRADGPALTPFTALTQTAAENAARTGAIAVVTSGMLASVFTQTAHTAPAETQNHTTLANATPVSNTVENTTIRAGLAENLVTKVKVTKDADFWAERGRVSVTPYAETEAGIAEAKAKAEAEARAKAEAEARAQAEAEAAAAEAAAEAAAAAEAEAAAAVEASTDLGQQAVNLALEYVGVPYTWGGSSPSEGFDCSGLINYVYAQLGVDLPRSSSEMATVGYQVSAADALPGDIVWTSGHVSLYAGDGMVVEAQQEGVPVQYTEMWQTNPVYIRVTG